MMCTFRNKEGLVLNTLARCISALRRCWPASHRWTDDRNYRPHSRDMSLAESGEAKSLDSRREGFAVKHSKQTLGLRGLKV